MISQKLTKQPKSHLHQPRGNMDNFKVNKKHDQGMEMVFFVVRLRICIGGVSFKLRLGFLCFVEMGVFVKFVD